MASNEKWVLENYGAGKEDGRDTGSRYANIEFHYTKKHLDAYITPQTTVLELGCGTGYYGMHYAPRCKAYVGVDLTPENIAIFQEKIEKQGLKNVTAKTGDATSLPEIPSGSFNVVLCLGPMYHLPPEEREQVFAECSRICKAGGIAAFAYINQVGVYAGACVLFGEAYPSALANQNVLEQGKDDLRPDLFFYTMPEAMEEAAGRYGLQKLKNCGTDFFSP